MNLVGRYVIDYYESYYTSMITTYLLAVKYIWKWTSNRNEVYYVFN